MGIKESDSDAACEAPARTAVGSEGNAKPARENSADYFISIVEQAEATSRQTDWSSQEQANALYGGMATSEGMQWPGDQQRMLPQPDAAVLASGHMPPSSMWQLSSGLGVPPTSAALAMDHPALGFSLLQTRMQAPQKQETGPMAGPSGNHAQPSGQAMSGPFTSLGMYGGDFGALNPMPVVGLSGLLPGMNPPSGSSQGYAAVQQRQQQGIQQGISGSQYLPTSGIMQLPNSFGMSTASSFNVLPSSASFDTFSQMTPKSFGSEPLPRPASMPALMGGGPVQFEPGTGMPQAPQRRKGRGGRTAAMDPRLDPSIDPKRAKRILANRLSAARSKNKQRGHLDILEGAHNQLLQQKEELMRETAWLRVRKRYSAC